MLDRNDKWRSSGIGSVEVETWVVRRYEEADDCHTANVEQKDTDVNTADGFREITAWVLCLAGSDLCGAI